MFIPGKTLFCYRIGIVLIISTFCISYRFDQQFDSISGKVDFYPSSLVISHSPKPLTIYHDTKLINVHVKLNSARSGKP